MHCILYRSSDYEDLTRCPVCGTPWYKCRKDGGDEEILKHMSASSKEAELLRWHARRKDGENRQARKNDGMYRHPADSIQWKNFDQRYEDFAREDRNIRLALSTDGMNPFADMSVAHDTWPVVLCIYNLPPWLCHKRKYLMLSVLISGKKQPGVKIDVYLRPLIDDLKTLWFNGVEVWDDSREITLTCMLCFFVRYRTSQHYIVCQDRLR